MAYELTNRLEEGLTKYGGEDEAYRQTLKKHLKGVLGFSNYVSRLNEVSGKAIGPNLKGNITPGGVKALVAGEQQMQADEIGDLKRIAGAVEGQADVMATDQQAREKKAAEASLAFKPNDWVDEEILKFMQNPVNPDGSKKTLQQFKEEILGKQGAVYGEKWNEESAAQFAPQIEARIASRVPKDFEANSDTYRYRAMGYSKSEAEDMAQYSRYADGSMSPAEKAVYEVVNPTSAERAKSIAANKGLLQDIQVKVDPKTGESTPQFTYDELRKKYPNVEESQLKDLVRPVESQSLQSDIDYLLNSKGSGKKTNLEELQKVLKDPNGGYLGVTEQGRYKEMRLKLKNEYGSIFTDQEIDQMLYNKIMSK